MILLSLLLTSCGILESGEKGQQLSVRTSVEAQKNEEDRPSLTLPPEIREHSASSQSDNQNSGGLKSLKGLKGINIENLFSEKLRDKEKRIERLENAFLDLHRQFKTLEPAIIRLVAIEEDMKNLTDLLSGNLEEGSTPTELSPDSLFEKDVILAPQKTAPVQQGYNPQPIFAKQPQNGAASMPLTKAQKILSDIRVGHHPKFTRVVIDAQQDILYEASFDETYKKFTIKVSDALWTGQVRQDYLTHPLLDYYTVEALEGGHGTQIHLHFKVPVTLSHEETLRQEVQPVSRLVFDFKIR